MGDEGVNCSLAGQAGGSREKPRKSDEIVADPAGEGGETRRRKRVMVPEHPAPSRSDLLKISRTKSCFVKLVRAVLTP